MPQYAIYTIGSETQERLHEYGDVPLTFTGLKVHEEDYGFRLEVDYRTWLR